MSLVDSIKPFWPLLFTFILPRAYGYFQSLKTAYRTQPPAKPLPRRVDRSLNIFFGSVLFFLVQSFSRGPLYSIYNIFVTTSTRLGVPSDVLWTRLAMTRPNGILTPLEIRLQDILINKDARLIYLTYGPDTLLNCPFCHISQPQTYILYHLSSNVFLPHFIHFVVIGLATSGALTSPITARWRSRFMVPAFIALALDMSLNTLVDPVPTIIDPQSPGPYSLFVILRVLRPLIFCALDAFSAFYIWANATNRFLFFPFLADPNALANTDLPTLQAQAQELVGRTGIALQTAQAKMRAYAVARNTVVRDKGLQQVEDAYWREVKRREGQIRRSDGQMLDYEEAVFQEEEVQAAIARVYGSGGIDVPKARKEAAALVDGVTQGLENDVPI